MNRQVDAAGRQRLFDFLCEQALAADLAQGAVGHAIAGGLDDGDRERRFGKVEGRHQPVARFMGLRQGKRGTSGADAAGIGRVGQCHVSLLAGWQS